MYKKESILEFKEKFYDLIKDKKVLFVGHKGPDDDCVASLLGCYYKFGQKIAVSGEKKDRWYSFEDFDKLLFVEDIANLDFDIVVLLDSNEWSRFSSKDKTSKPIICIDHHPKQEQTFDLEFIDPRYSSVSEIIYDMFYKEENISKKACEALLMGILGDTGNFSFVNPIKSSALNAAYDLINKGNIEVQTLQSKYNNFDFMTAKYLGEFLANLTKKKIGDWPLFVYSFVDLENDYVSEAAAMFKNKYTRGIEGVTWGFTIRKKESENGYSYSFRSLPGSVNVRLLCEKLELGGGHDRAAGGFYECDTLEDAIAFVLKFLEENSFEDFR
jgi:nanoRNase/pAp phosphatase (c-di-AMP/oligoRNAs hydrolase)